MKIKSIFAAASVVLLATLGAAQAGEALTAIGVPAGNSMARFIRRPAVFTVWAHRWSTRFRNR